MKFAIRLFAGSLVIQTLSSVALSLKTDFIWYKFMEWSEQLITKHKKNVPEISSIFMTWTKAFWLVATICNKTIVVRIFGYLSFHMIYPFRSISTRAESEWKWMCPLDSIFVEGRIHRRIIIYDLWCQAIVCSCWFVCCFLNSVHVLVTNDL